MSTNTVSFANNVAFPTATGGSESEVYFGIGESATGAGTLLYFGPLNYNITVSSGVTPYLVSGTTVVSET